MKGIKEIKRIAENGYIDDPLMVREIVNDFLNLKMRDLGVPLRSYDSVLKSILILNSRDPDLLEEYTYRDMLNLINSIDGSDETSKHELIQFYAWHLAIVLLKSEKNSLIVKRFLGLNSRAFFEYLESRHSDGEVCFVEEYVRLAYSGLISEPSEAGNIFNAQSLLSVLLFAKIKKNAPEQCFKNEHSSGKTGNSSLMVFEGILFLAFIKAFRDEIESTFCHGHFGSFEDDDDGSDYYDPDVN